MWVQTWQQSSNVNHVLRFVYLFLTKQCLDIVLSIMLKLKHCDVSIQSRNILICIRNSHLYKRRPLCNPSYINVYMLVLVTDCFFFYHFLDCCPSVLFSSIQLCFLLLSPVFIYILLYSIVHKTEYYCFKDNFWGISHRYPNRPGTHCVPQAGLELLASSCFNFLSLGSAGV